MPFSGEEYLKPAGKLKVTFKLHLEKKYLNSENFHALLVVLLGITLFWSLKDKI